MECANCELSRQGCGEVQLDGVSPNSATYICSMKACISVCNVEKGQQIHDQVRRNGLLYSDVCVGNALIDMYVKLGLLEKAQNVFDEIPVRDVVSWTTLISGYAHNGCGQKALNYFSRMQHEGVYSNVVTLVCMGHIETGKRVMMRSPKRASLKMICLSLMPWSTCI